MGDTLTAPSVPKDNNSSNSSGLNDLPAPADEHKIDNQSFLNKFFKKKKKQPESIINKDLGIKIKEIKPKQEAHDLHVLDQINKVDHDIQIKQEIHRYPTSDSIEEIHFGSKTKDGRIEEDNIKQLRKALGLVKDKSDKVIKIEKFKDSLFDESTKEQEIVTNLSLEEKLGVKLDQPPSEEVQHLKIGITIDTNVPEVNVFKLTDDRQLRSLRDLKNSLENMNDSIFSSHVFGKKNDFASWIKNIMNEPELAKLIRKCKTKGALLSMLVSLEKKEIEELIKLKKDEILKEHKESLKDLDFLNKEKKEINIERTLLNEEKSSIDKLKEEFEKKLKALEDKEIGFKADIEEAKIEKLSYEKREGALENAKKDYLNAIKNQSEALSKLRKDIFNQTQDYKEKLEEDYLKRRKDTENEFNARFITLEKSFEERRKQIKEDYELKVQRLNMRESNFREEQSEINKLYHNKLEELKFEETKIFDLQKELKEQELRLIKQESGIRKNLTELSKKLSEVRAKDEEVMRQVEFRKNLLHEIKQRELNLKKREDNLGRGVFQTYLNSELKKILNPKEEIEIKDQKHEKEIAETYAEIELCKKILEKGKLREAQQAYKQIRKNFYNLKLEQNEKEILYNAIKELYADIQIMMI